VRTDARARVDNIRNIGREAWSMARKAKQQRSLFGDREAGLLGQRRDLLVQLAQAEKDLEHTNQAQAPFRRGLPPRPPRPGTRHAPHSAMPTAGGPACAKNWRASTAKSAGDAGLTASPMRRMLAIGATIVESAVHPEPAAEHWGEHRNNGAVSRPRMLAIGATRNKVA
jgi:hypothetical protein